MSDFISLGISKTWNEKLRENGIAVPTPVQQQAIPLIINRQDVIAQAQTGTGKTFAFVLPILEHLEPSFSHIQAVIVTPTRELALQITAEIMKMTNGIKGMDVLAVYGGQDVEKQLSKLKKTVQIVVGTPGRLLDHIRRGTIFLDKVSCLVLDEADQMLHIGFLAEVEEIITQTPVTRQTLLFSATMPEEIRKLAQKHMRDAKYIQIEKIQGPAESVKQLAIHTIDRAKQATLIELIETHRPYLAVIFCRTKRRVSKLYEALKAYGFKCDELHGDLTQAKREQVMKRFRDADIQLLIATDVASRGLDVEGVTHVYNYDIPQDGESYIHRIGRTGRAGMAGLAITLYSSKDRPTLDLIENELHLTIKKQNIGNMKKDKEQSEGSQKTRSVSKGNKQRNKNKGNKPNKEKRQEPKSANEKQVLNSKESERKQLTGKPRKDSSGKGFPSKTRKTNKINEFTPKTGKSSRKNTAKVDENVKTTKGSGPRAGKAEKTRSQLQGGGKGTRSKNR